MAKFSGFILSAILVVLCLWLSVFSFPNVIQLGDFPGSFVTTANASANAGARASIESASSQEESGLQASSTIGAQESTEAASLQSSLSPSQEGLESPDQSNLGYANTSLAGDLPTPTNDVGSEAEDAIKESGRAQGGKYVSIPSVEMDAFHRPAGSPYNDRVISTTRAVVPQTIPASYN
ncbi:MAG: hypothetical protein IJM54_11420 [Thermoguttaceae bacterium]|nr:hypothetical protein [Thermoguttaceae bacterium]